MSTREPAADLVVSGARADHTVVTVAPVDEDWVRDAPTAAGYRRDAIAALLLMAGTGLSAYFYSVINLPGVQQRLWLVPIWVVLITGPLALRRRFPSTVAVLVAAVFVAGQLLGVQEYLFDNICLFVAIYSIGAWSTNRFTAALVRAVIIAAMLIWLVIAMIWHSAAAMPSTRPGSGSVSAEVAINGLNLIINLLFFAGAWYFGESMYRAAKERDLLRQRTGELEREREHSAIQAVSLERLRIARELHDVVAHHVSVMGVQAAAARRVLSKNPAKASESLTAIESSARDAVGELHSLVHALRDSSESHRPQTHGPQNHGPDGAASTVGLHQLDSLLAETRAGGLEVRQGTTGAERPLAPTVELAAYRVVQEALTNCRKHAGLHCTVDVMLRYRRDDLEVDVSDDGIGSGSSPGQGFGLIGMRERAAAVGGRIEVGPKPRGGFRVRAHLPYRDATREPQ